jgi:hypothetical protein
MGCEGQMLCVAASICGHGSNANDAHSTTSCCCTAAWVEWQVEAWQLVVVALRQQLLPAPGLLLQCQVPLLWGPVRSNLPLCMRCVRNFRESQLVVVAPVAAVLAPIAVVAVPAAAADAHLRLCVCPAACCCRYMGFPLLSIRQLCPGACIQALRKAEAACCS